MPKPPANPTPEGARYALFDQLDRLEELLEDMTSLEIRSIDELEQRIETLNNQIDLLDASEDERP